MKKAQAYWNMVLLYFLYLGKSGEHVRVREGGAQIGRHIVLAHYTRLVFNARDRDVLYFNYNTPW